MLNIFWTYLLLYYMQEPSFNQNDTKTSVLLQKYVHIIWLQQLETVLGFITDKINRQIIQRVQKAG